MYIIMNDNMVSNINNKDNIQYFFDCTYYFIPPQCKTLKMWIILAFNKNYNKTVICNITLLKNENYETFDILLKYLKNKYKSNTQCYDC